MRGNPSGKILIFLPEVLFPLISNHVEHSRVPKRMVPTTVANLLYLDRPGISSSQGETDHLGVLGSLMEQPIKNGY